LHKNFISIDNSQLIYAVEKVITATKAQEAIIRITGDGEPTLVGDRELSNLIQGLKKIPQISKIKLTTNGILLGQMANCLKESGVDNISISLNSLTRDRYLEYSGFDYLPLVLKSISKAYEVGLNLKINAIYWKHNCDEIFQYEELSITHGNMPIKFFDLLIQSEMDKNKYLTIEELEQILVLRSEEISEEKFPYPKRIYRLKSGAIFEVKLSGIVNNCPNLFCLVRRYCLEGCRHSIRIGLDGTMKPCGIRDDNVIDLLDENIVEKDICDALRSGGKMPNGFGNISY
jgi:cyclic pyranopterin phosphate synthase